MSKLPVHQSKAATDGLPPFLPLRQVFKSLVLIFEELSLDRPQFGCRSQGCEFRTDSVVTLRKHQKIHGQPRFTCLICSKSFGHKYTLEQHQAVHTDERKFKCTICSFRFFIILLAATGALYVIMVYYYKPLFQFLSILPICILSESERFSL